MFSPRKKLRSITKRLVLTGDGMNYFDFQRGGLETAGRNGRAINLN